MLDISYETPAFTFVTPEESNNIANTSKPNNARKEILNQNLLMDLPTITPTDCSVLQGSHPGMF
jgi:hypothetical protein